MVRTATLCFYCGYIYKVNIKLLIPTLKSNYKLKAISYKRVKLSTFFGNFE